MLPLRRLTLSGLGSFQESNLLGYWRLEKSLVVLCMMGITSDRWAPLMYSGVAGWDTYLELMPALDVIPKNKTKTVDFLR